jgi:hypothetical protein
MAATEAGRSLISARDAMDLVLRIEDEAPVSDWRASGVQIWPAVRTRLGQALFREVAGLEGGVAHASPVVALQHGFDALRHVRLSAARLPRTGRVAAVFLSDGISHMPGPRGDVSRWCAAYADGLMDAGHRVTVLVPRWWGPVNNAPEVRAVHTWVSAALVRARLASPRSRNELPGYDRARAVLDERRLGWAMPARSVVALMGAAIVRLAAGFETMLRRSRCAVAPVVDYYSVPGSAFVLAARRAGIPSVDLQHGVQGPLHVAYGPWARLPADGWELLPDVFLVWEETDAAQIRSWAGPSPHDAIVGGDPLLSSWRSGAFGDPAIWRHRLADALPREDGRRIGLVTLSSYEDEAALVELLTGLASAGDRWAWFVRCHPTRDARAMVWRAIAAAPTVALDVDAAKAAPLFALLEVVDLHVTALSTVVLDAARAGVPSIITTPTGAELFASAIERGDARVASISDLGAFSAAVNAAPPRRRDIAAADASAGVSWLVEQIEHESAGS